MTIILITAALCLIGLTARSQTFAEWWRQKKTRIKYLHQQVAALEEAQHIIRHGYSIAAEGIHGFQNLAYEEFELHDNYFNGLEIISPELRNCPEIQECQELLHSIEKMVLECLMDCRHSNALTVSEQNDIKYMFNLTIDKVEDSHEILQQLLTDHQLKMTDGERLTSLRKLLDHLRTMRRLVDKSIQGIWALLDARQRDSNDIDELINLN